MRKKLIKILLFLIIMIIVNLIFLEYSDTKAATTIYVPLNGTYTLTETSSQYSVGDSSIASVSVGNQYSYVVAGLGTDSNYDGTEVDLNDCLYTFTASGNKYTINRNSVYLYLDRALSGGVYTYYANGTSSAKINVSNSNGAFTFDKSSFYLNFNSGKYITSIKSSSNKTTFSLYRKIQNGETPSAEIDGFIKVTSISSGTQYLIVKQDGNDYYLLYPTSSRTNSYTQTAKIYTRTGTDYIITGNSIGTTTLTINGNTYNIRVFDENTILDPDSNFTDKALTIGMGTTYKIKTDLSNVTWTSNDTSIATISSDGTVTPVSVGETTVIANAGGAKYSIRVRVISGDSSGVLVNILIDTDDDTIPYYNYNFGNDYYELKDGERVYLYKSSSNYNAMNFFGKPKNGKVLSYLTLGNGHTALTNNTTTEISNGNSTNLMNTEANNLTASVVTSGITNAMQQGIEGVMGFSRVSGVTAACTGTISVRSEDLSINVSQSVYSINGNAYQSGNQAGPGDTVIFEVAVSKPSTDEYLVTYEGTLTNSLSGAVFIGTSPSGTGNAATQSVTIGSTASSSQTYYVKYVVPNGTQGNVTNTVSYAYSTYANDALTTASYKIDRQAITASATVGASALNNTTITLTNNLNGNMREADKYFKFLVTINGTNGDEYRITGQDATVSYNGVNVNTSSTYTVGSTNYVYLKGGQTVTIGLAQDGITTQVPIGVTYTIVEQDAEDYSTTITGVQGTTKTTGNLTTGATNNIEFTNSRDRAALTGVSFDEAAYIVIILITCLVITVIKIRNIKAKK